MPSYFARGTGQAITHLSLGEADWDDPLNSSLGGEAWAAKGHIFVFLGTSTVGSLTVVATASQTRALTINADLENSTSVGEKSGV